RRSRAAAAGLPRVAAAPCPGPPVPAGRVPASTRSVPARRLPARAVPAGPVPARRLPTRAVPAGPVPARAPPAVRPAPGAVDRPQAGPLVLGRPAHLPHAPPAPGGVP